MSFRQSNFIPPKHEVELKQAYDKGFRTVEASQAAEEHKDLTTAAVLMQEAVEAFQHAANLEDDEAKLALVKTKIAEYASRCTELRKAGVRSSGGHLAGSTEASTGGAGAGEADQSVQFAQFYKEQGGRAADELRWKDAKDLYEVAVESFLTAAKRTGRADPSYQQHLREAEDLIDLMADLKAKLDAERTLALPTPPTAPPAQTRDGKASARDRKASARDGKASAQDGKAGEASGQGISEEEKQVLFRSSQINGRQYLPWIPADSTEQLRTAGGGLFTDPDGKLALSPAQAQVFGRWVRASELMRGGGRAPKVVPKMVHAISHYSVSQELVTNCSFVSSLCITASYERRFGKKLITKIIYPQNRQGEPVYNPSGKYSVKLHFNGVVRKVVVDDFLPVSKQGRLVCSFSTNPGELWVSVLEKAYMKLNGGYDFPGSNSGIDLYALTGWIPETHQLADLRQDPALLERTWQHMVSGLRFGDVLCTVATGPMSEGQAAALGLVPTHAYAVLDVRQVGALRLLQLKNPWAHMRWKGPYSPSDRARWTPALREALQYDQVGELQHDNGIFWIDLDSLLQYFSGLYFNWNLALLPYKIPVHRHWDHTVGPAIDTYNVGYNPQFGLKLEVPGTKPAVVWVVISRHVTDKSQLLSADDADFMAVHVYAKRQGRRVYYPADALVKGKYTNNPHGLVSFEAPPGESSFTLVPSLFEKRRPHDFTLTVYTHAPARMRQLRPTRRHVSKLRGQWDQRTAGGSGRHPSFLANPQWRVQLAGRAHLTVRLEAPRDVAVNVRLCGGGGRVASVSEAEELASSGDYHHGFCYLDLAKKLPPGAYTVVPSTFEPGQLAHFHLFVEADAPFQLAELPQEGAGLLRRELQGSWAEADGTAAGCNRYKRYDRNPWVHLGLSAPADVMVRLQGRAGTGKGHSFPSVNASLFRASRGEKGLVLGKDLAPQTALLTTAKGVFSNPPAGTVSKLTRLPAGDYVIIPATFKPVETTFNLILYSSKAPAVFKRIR